MSIESSTSDLVLFPGPFLYKKKLQNHDEIKEKLLPWITQRPVESCYDNFNDKSGKFGDYLELHELFSEIVFDPVASCIESLPFNIPDVDDINLQHIWYNNYKVGESHGPHVHADATFSGVYLLHVGEENNTIFFGAGTSNTAYQNFSYDTKHISEGSVLVFPSDMYHCTEPAQDNRITISFNVTCTFFE